MKEWTYAGYWSAVLGTNRSAADVLNEFDLRGDPASLDEWLGVAESEAWAMGRFGGDIPSEWRDYHAWALTDLRDAL